MLTNERLAIQRVEAGEVRCRACQEPLVFKAAPRVTVGCKNWSCCIGRTSYSLLKRFKGFFDVPARPPDW